MTLQNSQSEFSPFEIACANILFLFAAFPYIVFVRAGFDIQPYPVVFASLYILLFLLPAGKADAPPTIWLFFLFFAYALAVYCIHSHTAYGMRSLVGYFTLFAVGMLAYKTFPLVNAKCLLAAICVYSVVGFIQFFVLTDFAAGILPRLSTGGTRGITSLSVEPSQYAIICLFFLALLDLFRARKELSERQHALFSILLFVQMFITLSGMSLVLFALYIFVKFLLNPNVKKIVAAALVCLLVVFLTPVLLDSFPSLLSTRTRAGSILSRFADSGVNIVNKDQSMNDRFAHMVIPVYSVVSNHGLGHGLGTWAENAERLAKEFVATFDFFTIVNFSTGGRIMSGWGTVIYELGAVGALIPLAYLFMILRCLFLAPPARKAAILSSVVLFCIPFMALSIAFPLQAYLTGAALWFFEASA